LIGNSGDTTHRHYKCKCEKPERMHQQDELQVAEARLVSERRPDVVPGHQSPNSQTERNTMYFQWRGCGVGIPADPFDNGLGGALPSLSDHRISNETSANVYKSAPPVRKTGKCPCWRLAVAESTPLELNVAVHVKMQVLTIRFHQFSRTAYTSERRRR
jgi:hypothetical protein